MPMTIEQKVKVVKYLYPDAELIVDYDQIIWLDSQNPLPADGILQQSVDAAELHHYVKNKVTETEERLVTEMANGLDFLFLGSTQDKVQTREKDKINLLGIAVKARELHGVGYTDPFTVFRAESNTEYPITPQEGIDLTNAALTRINAVYAECWRIKNGLSAATTLSEAQSYVWSI